MPGQAAKPALPTAGNPQPPAGSPPSPAADTAKAAPDTPGETAKPVATLGHKTPPATDSSQAQGGPVNWGNLTLDRTLKAAVRYDMKARVLSGQNRNPWDTVNLFPANPDMPKPGMGTSLATHFSKPGQDALKARNDGLPLMSHAKATEAAGTLAADLPGQQDASRQAATLAEGRKAQAAATAGMAGRAADELAQAESNLAQVNARPAATAAGLDAAKQEQAAAKGAFANIQAGLNVSKAEMAHATAQALHGPQQTVAKWQVNQAAGIAQRTEQAFGQQHGGFVAAAGQQASTGMAVEQTEKRLADAKRVVASGRGSVETFEGAWSNGKDGAQSGLGLTAGIAAVNDAKVWSQNKMTAAKALTDVTARAALSGGAGLLATGIGTETGAALATKLSALAVDTEKGAALGGKFGGRWGSLAGGVVAGGVSVAAAVGVGHLTDDKDENGKSWLDRNVTDPVSTVFDPHKNKELDAALTGMQPVIQPVKHVVKAYADATDQVSDGVKQTSSWVGGQGGSAAGARGALSVRASTAAVARETPKVEAAAAKLEAAVKEKDAASQALADARALRGAGAEGQVQAALTREGEAVMAHTASQAEHKVAQDALGAAQKALDATGAGTFGKTGSIAAKSVTGWNPAKAGVQKEAIEAAETAAKDEAKRKAVEAAEAVAKGGVPAEAAGATEAAARTASRLGKFAMGTGKFLTHAGAVGGLVSGTFQTITDLKKMKDPDETKRMTGRHAALDIGTQVLNGAATGWAGAAAGAWAGAEAGGAVGAIGGPLGLAVGAVGGAVVGTAVSLGAGVVLDRAEHFVWHNWTPHAVKDWFK